MRSDVRSQLRVWLGEDLTLLEAMPDPALTELYGALETARSNQAKALATASDEALRQMPAPLRRTVGRILGH